MLAVDISNYTPPIDANSVQGWASVGVGLVISQAIDPPAGYPSGRTRAQIQTCIDAGMPVDVYIWLWFDSNVPNDIAHKLSLLRGLHVRQVWLDVEDAAAAKYDQATSEQKVNEALALCDSWGGANGVQDPRTGIYTGRWYWADSRYMGNSTFCSDRKLWDANYDGVSDPTFGFVRYGGWGSCDIKQWAGSTSLAGIGGLDINTLHPNEEQNVVSWANPSPSPEPGPEPMPDSDCDYGWQERKDEIVQIGGELKDLRDQLNAAAMRKGGPVRADILALAKQVGARGEKIITGQ